MFVAIKPPVLKSIQSQRKALSVGRISKAASLRGENSLPAINVTLKGEYSLKRSDISGYTQTAGEEFIGMIL